MISTPWSILLNNVNRNIGTHKASPINFFSRKPRALQVTVSCPTLILSSCPFRLNKLHEHRQPEVMTIFQIFCSSRA
jgi:hypothetical protein